MCALYFSSWWFFLKVVHIFKVVYVCVVRWTIRRYRWRSTFEQKWSTFLFGGGKVKRLSIYRARRRVDIIKCNGIWWYKEYSCNLLTDLCFCLCVSQILMRDEDDNTIVSPGKITTMAMMVMTLIIIIIVVVGVEIIIIIHWHWILALFISPTRRFIRCNQEVRLLVLHQWEEEDCDDEEEEDDDDDGDDWPLLDPPLMAWSTTLATAPLAAAWAAWPIAEVAEWWWLLCCWCWRLEWLLYKERRLNCFSVFLTQVGNVFDQNETYDWAVSGDLIGLATLLPPAAAELAAPAPVGAEELAAWATKAALLTMEEAADRALAKFGRDPLDEDGARTAAKGDEAAAETRLLAPPTGRVWM